MTRFIALLAIASGLLLVESKADETDKYCIYPQAEALDVIEQGVKEHGFKMMVLKGPMAQAYYDAIREQASGPILSGIHLVIIYNPGKGAAVFAFRGENRCGHTMISWPLHSRAIIAADRASI
jgi:hypothetical protein